MAPTQARSRKQNGPAKAVTRKPRAAQPKLSSSWEVLNRQRSDSRDSDIENEDPTIDDDDMLAIAQPSPNDTILALQEMADRLGREVEMFAESLDKFLGELQPSNVWESAHDLVLEYRNIAAGRVAELKEKYEREHKEELRREWAQEAKLSSTPAKSVLSSSLQARSITSASVKELRKYQEEADTWDLFRIVLEQHYRPQDGVAESERQERLSKLSKVNRYTNEGALFDRFVLTDSLGQERALIKTWLEQTATNQQPGIDGITQELETRSKVGSGLWTRGWLSTREKIKNEKRLRTWPAPDSSPLPQLRSVETNDLLITSLDPDATSRQDRSIEKQDDFYERAVWVTCWEMLRRGVSWDDVANWCEAQNEGWRAIVMGKGMSDASAAVSASWRRMCFLASQGKCSNEHEAAVYGLLGGNLAAMQPVCRSVDDQLFAHFSVNLIRQFDQYLATAHPEHVPRTLIASEDSDVMSPEVAQQEILELITKMRMRSETKSQSVSPLKLVQSYLLANETESLINTLGVAIAADETASDLAIARPRRIDQDVATQPEAEAALDPMCLRVVTHISIIMQVLRQGELDVEDQEMEDNVLVSYIQSLHIAGKRDMTPVYASRLQKPRYVATMATVLPSIVDSKERQQIVILMLQYDMDATAVIQALLEKTLEEAAADSQQKAFSILQTTDDVLYPGKRVALTKLPDTVSAAQESLIKCLEWFLLLPGQWDETFDALTAALRKALGKWSHNSQDLTNNITVTGNFACARLIAESFKSQKVSEAKSYQILGRTVHLFDNDGSRPADETEAAQWTAMQKRAKTYLELERLVDAFELLFNFVEQEAQYLTNRVSKSQLPPTVKQAFEQVMDAMDPVLSGDGFLLDAFTEEEAADFSTIRKTYVTEAILAYVTVLCSAGAVISRDMLLKALDVSTVVADPKTKLTDTFTDAKRMKELVTMFAQVSKRILLMKGMGKAWKPKHEKREGRTPHIWDIDTSPTPTVTAAEV